MQGGPWYRGWSPFFGGEGAHQGYRAALRAALRARQAERQFAVQLRRIARQVGDLVRGMAQQAETPQMLAHIQAALEDYGRLVAPWAQASAQRLLTEVMRRDAASWHQMGQAINRQLLKEIQSAPIGPTVQELLDQTTRLITSIPQQAAERVQRLALEAALGGRRWEDIARDLMATGRVTVSRANLIARTETGRASTTLTQVRAQHVGSEGYIWRTAKDLAVRPRHRQLEGSFHRWDDPPNAAEPGQRPMHYHPGAGPNCRCFPEIVLPGGEHPRMRPRSAAYLAALREAGYTEGAAFE